MAAHRWDPRGSSAFGYSRLYLLFQPRYLSFSPPAHTSLSGTLVSNFNLPHMHRKRCIYLFHHNVDLCLPDQGLPWQTDELRTDTQTHTHTEELKLLCHTDVALTAQATVASHLIAPRRGSSAPVSLTVRMKLSVTSSLLPTTHCLKNPADTHTSSKESSALTFLFLAAQGLGTNWV